MTHATITMRLPNASKAVSATYALDMFPKVVADMTDALRNFASSRGVCVRAVDYSVTVN